MLRKRHLLLVLLLLVYATSAFAAGYPSTPQGYGTTNNVSQNTMPDVVLEYYWDNLAQEAKDYDMPTFTREGWSSTRRGEIGRATSHEDMIAYLQALPTENMQMRFVGEILTYDTNNNTPEDLGPPLRSFKYPILVFTREGIFDPEEVKALGRPVVLLEGSIHGGEYAASEAMLPIAKRLARKDVSNSLNELLDRVSVVVIPRYNPDGTWKNTRTSDSYQPWQYTSVANALERGPSTPYTTLNGLDMNRDQTSFEMPIVRLVHQIWNAYEPHFIADGHQQYASVGGNNPSTSSYAWADIGIATLFTSNPNTPEELDVLAHDGITFKINRNDPSTYARADSLEHLAKRALRADGINWWNYGENGGGASPDRTGTYPVDLYTGTDWIAAGTGNYMLNLGAYQEGNPEEGITDTAARIKGAFGLLAEVGTPGGPNTGNLNYHRRVRSYEIVCEAMIRAFADPERGPILKKAVDDARKAMATGTSVRNGVNAEDLVIAIKNTNPQPVHVEMPDETGIPAIRLVRDPASPDRPMVSKDVVRASIYRSRYVVAQDEAIVPHSTVKRPTAYIVNCDPLTAGRIAYTGVRIERLAEPVTVPVEYYTVKEFGHQTTGTNRFRYFKETPFEQSVPNMQLGIVAVDKGTKQMSFSKDTFVIFMDQYNSVHASLTLEPMGARNYGNYWFSRAKSKNRGFLPVALNEDFPAYRYMGETSAIKTYFAGDIMSMPFVDGTHIEWPLLLTQEQKAAYVNTVLNSKTELLEFSGIIVNKLAGKFNVYLKKTEKPGNWYTWDWTTGKAVELVPSNDGYAAIMGENIGPDDEVILFFVASVLPCGDPALLPESGVTVQSSINSSGNLTVTIDNAGLSNGEQVKFFFIESKDEFYEIAKTVTRTGSGLIEAIFTAAELLALGIEDGTEYAIQYSNIDGDVVGYSTFKTGGFTYKEGKLPGTGGGCSAGFAVFALLMLIPFVQRKKR